MIVKKRIFVVNYKYLEMKRISLIVLLFLSFISVGQTKIYNQKVKYKVTPNLSVIDSLLTKDSNDLLSATSVNDFISQIGLNDYLKDVVEDLTPQLGGNLDMNSQDITGVGSIDIAGNITNTATLQTANISASNNITFSNYPNTRVDLSPVNILHTDLSGNLQSSSITYFSNIYVDLSTNQTVSGIKKFSENVDLVKYITQNNIPFFHNYEDPTTTGANTFAGYNSGNFTLSAGGGAVNLASSNAAFGYNTLNATTTGYDNTAIGPYVLQLNTTGFRNTGVGVSALSKNTIGDHNLAVGQNALLENTIGIYNTALGIDALHDNVNGSWNLAIGQYAQLNNISGFNNVGIATSALSGNKTGSKNTAVGVSTFMVQDGVDNNTAFGYEAGKANLSGVSLTFLGNQAGLSNTTGDRNTYIGNQVGYTNETGQNNTAVGHGAFFNNLSGSFNTSMGYQSLFNNTSGNNTAIGTNTLFNSVNSSSNVAVGYSAGDTLIGGNSNTFIGNLAGSNVSQNPYTINSMALGNGSYTTLSNQIVIGNDAITETQLKGNVKISTLNLSGIQTYADDTAAGVGGLVSGDVYKTATGDFKIKM